MQSPKHIHLIGICGTAMASLAGMLQLQGHRITGSDAAAYPPMSDLLAGLNIPVHEPYAERNLEPRPDLVVVGNAISRGNVELEYVLDTRIPFCSMAAILHDEFLLGREALVVAGTHGKTTTTSMLAWIYEVASRRSFEFAPSFLIGGVAENFGTSFMVRSTRPFVLEGDEYDTAFFDKGPKFLHYFPDSAILTHVEFDHADIYSDLSAVKTAFKRFVNLIPRRGRIVAFDGSENVSECVAKAFCKVERYGFAADSYWRVSNFRHDGPVTRWTVTRGGEAFAELSLPMAGEHNALNATAAAALAAGQGVPVAAIVEALATFKSVKRQAGGAGGGRRRDDHRRLCASSDGDPRDAAGSAGAVSGAAAGGGAGASVEYAAAECLRVRTGGQPWAGRSGGAVGCVQVGEHPSG